ncbi:MAG: protein translocase subunit SecF [Methanomicrobiales archaeon]|nr:protein translocase subunit SecF [Methanomicrobiales archaeon]
MGLINYNIEKYSPKQLVIIPLVILFISLLLLFMNIAATGMPVKPGIDFSGGTAVTLSTTETADELRSAFAGYPLTEVSEGVNSGKFLKFGAMEDSQFRTLSTMINQYYPDAKIDQIGESFGKTLQQQALLALVFSFIGMAVVVFLAFRALVPAFAIVITAFADIVMTAAAMNLIGIPLTLGTTAALLMLIGYSVDSDLRLTNRVLKRQGKLIDKIKGAFDTGISMTSTTFAAIAAMLVVSWIGSVEILMQISAVLLIGLVFDLMNTWLTNVAILKWYVQKGGSRQ